MTLDNWKFQHSDIICMYKEEVITLFFFNKTIGILYVIRPSFCVKEGMERTENKMRQIIHHNQFRVSNFVHDFLIRIIYFC